MATGRTKSECLRRLATALEFHFEGLREEGLPIPPSRSYAGVMKVAG